MKIQENYILIKKRNIPDYFDFSAVKALIDRIAGYQYADKFVFRAIESDGFDCYEIFDIDDKICICANSGTSAAVAFNRYLKDICHYSVGMLSTSGTLPEQPPCVGGILRKRSRFLYRYFFNYCAFSYTFAFDNWTEWEKTLDRLLLSGYNLILNPIGTETVWRNVLQKLRFSDEDVDRFLCGPAFYAWQWMMNMTGWAGGAPAHWYDSRAELAGRINRRLQSFGAATVIPGYAGMVPNTFGKYFPNSLLIDQGYWVGFKRPNIILPDDPNYHKVADLYYEAFRSIEGCNQVSFFSADPFHEGGITEGVDMTAFAQGIYGKMKQYTPNAVWVMQEWGKPKTELIESLPDGSVLVLSLCADNKPTSADKEDIAPWCYCAVNAFGGQYAMHGAGREQLLNPFEHLKNETSKIVGMGYMPESVNCNEILYSIVAESGYGDGYKTVDAFLSEYVIHQYGSREEEIIQALRKVFLVSFHPDRPLGGESGLCARPALDVCRASAWSTPAKPYLDQSILVDYVKAMFYHYDTMSKMDGYCIDLIESTRQILSNLSWYYIEKIKESYQEKDLKMFSRFADEFLSLFDLQSALVSCDQNRQLGTWLNKARRWGKNDKEKAYFEENARLQITLWGDRNAAKFLRDYAAKEWQGMLKDFYKPRWERFIFRLKESIIHSTDLEIIDHYNDEIGFVYEEKEYPVVENTNLKLAVQNILNKVTAEKIPYRTYGEKQATFLENVMEDMTKE